MNDRSRLRLLILGVLVFSLPVTLLGRLWYMQALAGDTYRADLQQSATSTVATVAPRGLIVDDEGQPLATNSSALVVSAISTELPKANLGTTAKPKPNPKRIAEFAALARIVGVDANTLDAKATLCDYKDYGSAAPSKNPNCWTGSPLQPIPLVSLDNSQPTSAAKATQVAMQVLEQQEDFPGVTAQVEQVRAYPAPDNASAAQLIGNVGKITADQINKAATPAQAKQLTAQAGVGGVVGQAGLEEEYNSYLEGELGSETMSVDAAGNPTGVIKQTPATPGDELVTSIDARVQKIAEQALADGVQAARTSPQLEGGRMQTQQADAGAAIVMDNRTGALIAVANYPTYDPGVWDGNGIAENVYKQLQAEPGNPLFSQAIQGQYAPGSTFKVITTAGAVASGHYSLGGQYECPSTFSAGGRSFQNFEGEVGKGKITFEQALTISCDTFFYSIANTLWNADGGIHPTHPADSIVNEALDWGVSKDTEVDLPIDATGSIQTRQQLIDTMNKDKPLWCADAKTDKDPEQKAIDESNCITDAAGIYQVGDALNTAIGQGEVTVSPLQLATMYSAVANGGTLFSPRLGKAIVAPDGSVVRQISAPSRKLEVPASVLSYEQQALQQVVADKDGGTAYSAFVGFPLDRYTIAGKTGTAEVQAKNKNGTQKDDTAWFASFGGPAGQPAQYTVVVMISQGGQGGVTAAPVARQIYDGLYGLDGDPSAAHYNADDKFGASGPALPNGAPPTTLPKLDDAPVTASASPSAEPSSVSPAAPSPPQALGAPSPLVLPPDRRVGSGAWAR